MQLRKRVSPYFQYFYIVIFNHITLNLDRSLLSERGQHDASGLKIINEYQQPTIGGKESAISFLILNVIARIYVDINLL